MSADLRPRRRGPRARFQLEPLERRELLTVQFASAEYAFGKAAPSAIVTLVRSPNPIMNPEVAQVATVGGTARPDVDFTPISQKVTFQDGEFTKQVTVPLLTADQTGNVERTLQLAVQSQDNRGNMVQANATVRLVPRGDITPPTVTDAVQLRQKGLLTGFKITFSKDMDRATAENVRNYRVQGFTPERGGFSLSGRPKSTAYNVVLSKAEYDPETRTVLLTVRKPQVPGDGYLIANPDRVDAQGNAMYSALKDSAGNMLDVDGNGKADGLLSLRVGRTVRDTRKLEISENALKAARRAAANPPPKPFKLPFSLSTRSNSAPT